MQTTPSSMHACHAHHLESLAAQGLEENGSLGQITAKLVDEGLDQLPLPGAGNTLGRWRALSAVGRVDQSLAKLYEGHTDALAILDELKAGATTLGTDHPFARPEIWGVWAAEPPDGRVFFTRTASGVLLNGIKRWCSGASSCTHALLTAWEEGVDQPLLVRLVLGQPGVRVDPSRWQAVGMARTASADVRLADAMGELVGGPGCYLSRAGFWHGGAGVAACWFGGCQALGGLIAEAVGRRGSASDAHLLAAAGRIDVALHATAALFREGATWIDAHPQEDAQAVALRLRVATERLVDDVVRESMRALGPGPFCQDRQWARLVADLPIFVRQSHSERDHAVLAQMASPAAGDGWLL